MADTFEEAAAEATESLNGQEALSEGQETQEQQASDVFYDATKVPEALRPSFTEMQKAWTQKTQEIAPYRQFAEKYGDVNEVSQFLDRFSTPESIVSTWVEIGKELGLTEDQLVSLFDAVEGDESGEGDEGDYEDGEDPYNQPMTRAEFIEWQQAQMEAAQEAQEDDEVEDLLRELNLEEDDENIVAYLASLEDPRLDYAERIKRGFDKFNGKLSASQSAAAEKDEKLNKNAPVGLNGSSPAPDSPELETMHDAHKATRAFLDSL